MGLELLAIALGLCTFSEQLRGRRVLVWSDNTGSEASVKKGVAKSWDHSCIVHSVWLKAARIQADLFVQRVPALENIADLPSREEYGLLRAIGAVHYVPVLDQSFWQPGAWESLSLMHARKR